MQLIPDDATDGLRARVLAQLSARLDGPRDRPVAVGLSGGGDSLALLALACEWGQKAGRRILALTVDHRLNPDSEIWTQRAGQMARDCGADWRGLVWEEARTGTAIQERARLARHALLAGAAREAGASVILLGHTASDALENDWMRAQGTAVGELRRFSPSPVWPQGRGISIFRPLLSEQREDLRHWLGHEGLEWIDDPANTDDRYARVRARKAITGRERAAPTPASIVLPDAGPDADLGVFRFSRSEIAQPRALAVALLCASGQSVPPRGERLDALVRRVAADMTDAAVLAGARVEMDGPDVRIFREAGEQRRSGLAVLSLRVNEPVVWDGRFEITARENGWQVMSADGFIARLSDRDRRALKALPAHARPSMPVLYKPLTGQYVLGDAGVNMRGLCGRRYRATSLALAGSLLDETTQESALFDLWHGETGSTALFSF